MSAPEGPMGTALTLGVQLIRSDVWVLASIIAAMSRPCRMPDLLSASD